MLEGKLRRPSDADGGISVRLRSVFRQLRLFQPLTALEDVCGEYSNGSFFPTDLYQPTACLASKNLNHSIRWYRDYTGVLLSRQQPNPNDGHPEPVSYSMVQPFDSGSVFTKGLG